VSRRARIAAAVLALLLQLVVLYAARAPAVVTSGLPLDKVAHALVFALPTVALIAAGVPRLWVIGLMAVHAPVSELIQQQVLGARSGEVGDVVADLVGVGIGAWIARPGGRLIGRRSGGG
jgi:VanZ family protein